LTANAKEPREINILPKRTRWATDGSEADEQRGGRMAEDEKARMERLPPGRRPASKWWLLAKDGDFGAWKLVAVCDGEKALPVYSGEAEAEMFAWLGGAFEDGWRVRQTSAGELVSILCGPCAGVGRVALDPSPWMAAEEIRLLSVSRKRFVSRIVGGPCSYSAKASAKAGVRHRAQASVRLL